MSKNNKEKDQIIKKMINTYSKMGETTNQIYKISEKYNKQNQKQKENKENKENNKEKNYINLKKFEDR